jgi:starch-binding outer membrane protein, SusD/RagB family
MTTSYNAYNAEGTARRPLTLLALAALLAAGACGDVLSVESPDVVQPPQLNNPAGADALTNGALAAIYSPFITHVYYSGIFSDEFMFPTIFTTFADVDFRTQSVTYTEYGPTGMHQPRTQAQMAIEARRKYAPNPRSKIGQLFGIRGFAELYLGETSCNGTPLTEVVDLKPVWGGPLTSDSMLKRSVADFDSALVYAADSVRITNYLRVARGRALVDLGRFAEAAASVAPVPTSYVFNAEITSAVGGQSNTVWSINNTKGITVSNREGINGLDFVTANDPRVPTTPLGLGSDGQTQSFLFAKYTSLTSPIPMATGLEARLIEAEAALKAGDVSGWLAKLNDLRATAISPAMAPLTDPGTANSRVDLTFRERAFWLFGTGHRMGDLRRLLRQYGRTVTQTWPTGPYKAGVNYGTDVVFILTLSEQSNPNLHYCTDRNP